MRAARWQWHGIWHLIEFEAPDEACLVSDYDAWHDVLNGFAHHTNAEWDEWDTGALRLGALPIVVVPTVSPAVLLVEDVYNHLPRAHRLPTLAARGTVSEHPAHGDTSH